MVVSQSMTRSDIAVPLLKYRRVNNPLALQPPPSQHTYSCYNMEPPPMDCEAYALTIETLNQRLSQQIS